MAKFQLCEFRRTKPEGMFKADPKNKWERGLACVKDFGYDVDYILDDEGDKVRTVFSHRLLRSYGGGTIDTEDKLATY